ncbi:iron complex transport system substrate-binding protein [Dyadobacter sp. BE34]|uniref:Iron complex transport system substrate-binding protein n=1 Tax=Dyadobacter fermentans TaxID=94254 RepID=A0ABU1R2S2_9BACT|nr:MULTISPECIES: ABC transporter substrate-binding protein [Dyadobacter]MDR6807716.1 iron complex transport system substrate-binding protein [Dyadobacter fermentans]MDR7045457.1 iron complex transport system substrate-binding protein [Dyadobacter sp. BE242]MDR7199770.1 iron complex transport system substrate-binding protein [Dyadobacter sp. BE34]MDR7217771.1 iron complex transport system substrate-binding protein [Dyadobacter sp. BE31]MDR7265661.1 iron complex transport system substrate-bindin
MCSGYAKALRIVSANGTLSEILVGLGLEKQIVGVDVTSTFPASLEKLPKIGHNRTISAEGILALNPDVILYTDKSMLSPAVVKQLNGSGKKLVEFKHEYSKEGAIKLIREMGAYFKAQAQAEKMINALRTDLAKIPAPANPKKLLFIYARGAGTLMVSGTGTSLDKMFALAGHKNAVSGFTDFKPLTAESLIAANPDVLVLFSSGLESLEGMDGLLKVPGVANTNAGKNRRIVTMDGQLLTGFGPRVGKAAIELSQKVK